MNGCSTKAFNYQERVILYLYKVFFCSNYNDDRKNEFDEVNCAHLKMQKLMYILYIYGLQVGSFSFVWNKKGPYSYDLACMLKNIDEIFSQGKPSIIQQVEKDDFASLELNDYECLVNDLNAKLEINKYKSKVVDWIELLGSLVYLSQTILPGCYDSEVLEELYKRKEKYIDKKDWCDEALVNLKKVGLLTCA